MKRLRRLLGRRRIYADLSAEIRAHLDEKVQELAATGMPVDEAMHAARRQFGNVLLKEQEGREVWRWAAFENFLLDLRHALRSLRKSPGFAAIAILTLALGIGANTAIFSYVDAWLIQPLPYPQADRLMVFLSHNTQKGWTYNNVTSTADFVDFQEQTGSFQQTVAWTSWEFNLTGDAPPALVDGGRVSWNFFQTLGVKPFLGRTFTADEDRPGAGHVVILSEGLWRSRFAGDAKVIGRSVQIGGETYAVVGVMPGTFQFPLMGIANMWTPLALTDGQRANRKSAWFDAFGRLRPGVTQAQAQAETAAIYSRFEREFPQTNTNMTTLLSPMSYEIKKEEGTQGLLICLWIVGLVLLIACANVANLLLARASRRVKEFAMRGALGATRGRLARQMLTESLLLFLLGGGAGTLFGLWGMRWIENSIPGHIRGYLVNYGHVDLSVMTLAFTLSITLFCGIVFSLVPAIEHSRVDLNRALKEASGQASGSGSSLRLRRIFVGGEVALAVVVLIATGLLVKSFLIAVMSSPGFQPDGILVAQLSLPKTKYAEDARLRAFSDQVHARLRALPGVQAVGAASSLPFGGFGQNVSVEPVDKPSPQPGEILGARFTAVSPDYFSAMRIRLLRGRFFTSADGPGNAPVAIVSQTLASQFWPNEDPLGRKVRYSSKRVVGTIVGVVNDVKWSQLRARPERQLYVPLAQFPSRTLGFAVRAAGNTQPLATAIRDSIWSVDSDQPVSSVEQMGTLIEVVDAGNRVLTKLMVFFGVLAMLLGAIGIYGVMAQLVSQRSHEIGIRLALGAAPRQVMRLVVVQGLRLALVGIAIGLPLAFAVTRSLAWILYQVPPDDPATFLGVSLLFAFVAVAACYLPARRAMRVNPVTALRAE